METRELEEYRRQFAGIRQRTEELTAGLEESRFNWRPGAGQWSIEECLHHLTIAGQWEIRAIERAIEQARARGLTGAGPFRYPALDRFIIRQTQPPVRHKLPAPRKFRPSHGNPVTAIVPTFLHLQDQFLRQIARAEGLDLARVQVATPISGLLKMSLGGMFAQAAAHERRHLEQAWRVRRALA
jgi:hypothetical protein